MCQTSYSDKVTPQKKCLLWRSRFSKNAVKLKIRYIRKKRHSHLRKDYVMFMSFEKGLRYVYVIWERITSCLCHLRKDYVMFMSFEKGLRDVYVIWERITSCLCHTLTKDYWNCMYHKLKNCLNICFFWLQFLLSCLLC